MKITITESVYNWRTNRYEPYAHHTVEAETEEGCFKKIYINHERPNRYCSGHSIRLDDYIMDKKYREWKQHGVTIEMFYGSATID